MRECLVAGEGPPPTRERAVRRRRAIRFGIAGVAASALVLAASPAYGSKAPTTTLPVSGATATVTIEDGLSAAGTTVQPFHAQFTIAGISFPNHEGGNRAQPGNVFVHVTMKVTNLATAARLIPFNGSGFKTMALGVSHDVPAMGVNDDVCIPPALDGLSTNQQVATQVADQWCVVSSDFETVTLRPHKSKLVTFGGEVVSQSDAKPENFALIYSPADSATPTILPVGVGGTPTTVPG